jgi:outer membrane scaffolding protein for murein synthesis (MipA/OmpV family)
MKHFARILFSLLIFNQAAHAELKDITSIPLKISLGAGAAFKNNIRYKNTYKNSKHDLIVSAIPLAQISFGPLFIGQQGLTLSLIGNREKSFYINLNYLTDRYDGEGMQPRHGSLFFGAGVKYLKFNLLYSKDISERSNGQKINMSYVETYTISNLFFTRSSIGIEYCDRKFANYYFGVNQNEVTNSRPEYHPSSYFSPSISFFPGYKYNEHLSFMTGISVKLLSSQVRNSPTTKDDQFEFSLITGALWQL